jgi:hypothetical protein
MLIGTRRYAVQDVRVIRINYAQWLLPGYVLATVTASILGPPVTSTLGSVTLDPTQEVAFVTLNCGTVVNESFTVAVQAQDTSGQTINDQINVTIIAPGTS